MTKIVSFINLKGGVGKTTTAVNIAATIASRHNKRVLLIDLDPQTNATVCLIEQNTWEERRAANQTIFNLFEDLLEGKRNFDINQAIMKNVGGVHNLDLLPSSLYLVEIQDNIPDIGNKAFVSHIDVLGNAIEPIKNQYDYIIIDCPPNLGAITLNGINISHKYIIPTIPDILSKIGISLIQNRINNFRNKKSTCHIQLSGIIFTKVDYTTNLHNSTMTELRMNSSTSNYVFKAEFPQRIAVAEAPMDSRPFITSPTAKKKGKAQWLEVQGLIDAMTNEFIARV